MRKIESPDFTIKDILKNLKDEADGCIVKTIEKDKEKEFNKVVDSLSTYEKIYFDSYDTLSSLPTIDENDPNYYLVDIKNYYPKYHVGKSLYEYRVRMENSVEKRCPICDCSFGYSQVTLDHILPKSKFPIYSITPINLVPTCYNCNMRKNDIVPSKVLHPYFHGFSTFDYLSVNINVNEDEPFTSRINIDFADLNGSNQEEIKHIQDNIDLYKLRQKYTDLINIAFLKLLDEFQQVINTKNNVYSMNGLKACFTSIDTFIENNTYNFIDESFLRHLCILKIIKNNSFLSCLAKKLKIFVDYNNTLSHSMKKLDNKIQEISYPHQSNDLELIKETLPMIEFAGIYEFKDDSLTLINFRGLHQKESLVFNFKPEESYLNCIRDNRSFSVNESLLLSNIEPENQVGTKIVIPLKNKNFCILLVRGLFNIQQQELDELEPLVNKILC